MLAAVLWRDLRFLDWARTHRFMMDGVFLAFSVGVIALTRWSSSHDSIVMQAIGYTWFALFYAQALLIALLRPSGIVASFTRMKWLRELGAVSYCVYVIHLAVLLLWRTMLGPASLQAADWRTVAAALPAALMTYMLAKVSWKFFERPMMRRGHAFTY